MSIARGWGQDGWKHREEDLRSDFLNSIFNREIRKIHRKSKINNLFNVIRKEVK